MKPLIRISGHALSVDRFTRVSGTEQDFGLYPAEKDARGCAFRWTKRKAGISLKKLGDTLVVPLKASHPDVRERPVRVKVFSADPYFRKGELVDELVIRDHSWTDFVFETGRVNGEYIRLVFEVDRTWQPLKELGRPYPRWLGIGIGDPWFRYRSRLEEEAFRKTAVVPSERWEGKYGGTLWGNGESRLVFNQEEGDAVLRLHLRGDRAFGMGPYILLRIDGRVEAKTRIQTEEWTSLVLEPSLPAGVHTLAVEFVDDTGRRGLEADRNLFLGDLDIFYRK